MEAELSIDEFVSRVYQFLYLETLDSFSVNFLNKYIDLYLSALNKYSSGGRSAEDLHNLEVLTGPINDIKQKMNEGKLSENDERFPAIGLIIKRMNEYNDRLSSDGMSQTKEQTRVLTNSKFPKLYEDDYPSMNGFTASIIIVIITIILGVILAASLLFIL